MGRALTSEQLQARGDALMEAVRILRAWPGNKEQKRAIMKTAEQLEGLGKLALMMARKRSGKAA